jgi:hypothetical protein
VAGPPRPVGARRGAIGGAPPHAAQADPARR